MSNLKQKIQYLYPNALYHIHFLVSTEKDGTEYISTWYEENLGPQPDKAVFEAVTQEQIDTALAEKTKKAAKDLFLSNLDVAKVIQAFLDVLREEINLIRKTSAVNLPLKSFDELKEAVSAKIDEEITSP